MAFNRDGTRVVTGAFDGARVFDLSRARAHLLAGHEARIWSASLSHDRRTLATAGFDGTARLWSLDGDRPPLVLRGHTKSDVYSVVFSDDDRLLATGGEDGTARLWDVERGAELRVFPGHAEWVYGLAFSLGLWLALFLPIDYLIRKRG